VNCRLLPNNSLHVKNRQELVLYYVIETNLLQGPILYMAPILRTGHSENVPPLLVDESGSLEVLVRRQLRVTADDWGRGYCIERAVCAERYMYSLSSLRKAHPRQHISIPIPLHVASLSLPSAKFSLVEAECTQRPAEPARQTYLSSIFSRHISSQPTFSGADHHDEL
jgi:hypothetical protein